MADVFLSGMTTLENQYCGLRASFRAAACAAASLMLLGSGAAVAQTTWNASSGEWFDSSNWTAGTPNSSTSAIIDNGATVTILNTGEGTAEVDNLTIGSTSALDISSTTMNNSELRVFGTTISNAGAMSITQSSNMTSVEAVLFLDNSTTLSGGGTVTMGGGSPPDYTVFIEMFGNTTTQTLTSDNTIQGFGQIGAGTLLSLVNSGTVDANVSGATLYLNGGSGVLGANTGTLEATSGGTLQIDNSFNNKGGVILSNGSGSAVDVNGVTIQGGTLTTESGGFLGTAGNGGRSILDGSTEGAITLSAGSTYTTAGASQTGIEGTITLDAGSNFAIGTASSPGGAVQLLANTTITGAGTVTMTGTGSTTTALLESAGGSYTLTNQVLIQGYGQIGAGTDLTVANQATIDANVSGKTLFLNAGSGILGTNTGTLEATGGGILTIDNNIDNAGGVIISNGSGSTVNVNGVTIQGGTLTTESGGFMGTAGGGGRSILDGSTEGAITLSAGSTYTTAGGSQTGIIGTIKLGKSANMAVGTATSTSGTLQLTGAATIEGAGTVTMTGANAFIESAGGSYTLTNEATIQGYGQIGAGTELSLTNKGTVDANVSGQTLYFNGADFLNNGTVTVAAGATLNDQVSAFVQSKAAGGATPVTNVEGTLDVPSGFSLEGGTLEGTGAVDGAVDNTGGVVSPGDAPGTLTIDGAYTQGADGVFDVVIDSLTQYSQLDVTGAASLDGLLDVTSKFALATGDSFTIMELGSVTGDFTSFMYDGSTCTGGAGDTWSCANGAEFALAFNGPGTVDLDLNVLKAGTPTVPEPSTWAMMIVGFAALGFLAHRRQQRAATAA
jgi:PEP-CTERM motif